jgi:hypothetical protein
MCALSDAVLMGRQELMALGRKATQKKWHSPHTKVWWQSMSTLTLGRNSVCPFLLHNFSRALALLVFVRKSLCAAHLWAGIKLHPLEG